MDKRKAFSQASPPPDDDDRARKRRKQSTGTQQNGNEATPQSQGRALLNAVWNHQERNRYIRQHFEKLPSKDVYPDYYQKIITPISLHEIKEKLDKNAYTSFEEVKADFSLMCHNAANYNKPKSQIHSDSARIRNVVDAFAADISSANIKQEESTQPTPARPAARGGRGGPAALQHAQTSIIDDMLRLTDERGELVATYFTSLPSKKIYGDYYRIIKQPISLNMIKKRIKEGVYPTWSDFEQAVLLIRKNAEEFNDLESDIVKDARTLEEFFIQRFREEKAKYPDQSNGHPNGGSGIKLRLNIGAHRAQSPPNASPSTHPKIKLNIGSKNASQNITPATPTPATTQKVLQEGKQPPAAPQTLTNGNAQKTVLPIAATPRGNKAGQRAAANTPAAVNKQKEKDKVGKKAEKKEDKKEDKEEKRDKEKDKDAKTKSAAVAAQSTPAPPIAPTPAPQPVPIAPATSQPASMTVPVTRSSSRTPVTPTKLNVSKSPPADSITLRPKSTSHTPQPQANHASPPISTSMPPPPQRLSVTPAASTAPRTDSKSPAPIANAPGTPVPAMHQRQNHGLQEEPKYRAEGKDASSALITNLRIASASAINPEAKFIKDLSPDDHKLTSQYFLHLPAEFHNAIITPTLSGSLGNRPYRLTVEYKVNNNPPRPLNSSAQKKKDEVPFEVRFGAGVVNTIECTVVAAAQGKGQGTFEFERFRMFVSLLPA